MRKVISFILFLFYDYYKEGKHTKLIAYEQSILVFLFLVFMNLSSIFIFFDTLDLLPGRLSDPKWQQYLEAGVFYFSPGYLIIGMIFKKEDIISLRYDEEIVRKGKVTLFSYFAFSFLALMILAIIKHAH